MTEEKADWFIYTQGDSWGHPIGYGQLVKNITHKEAKKIAFKYLKGDFMDEGLLANQYDGLSYNLKNEHKDEGCKEELEDTLSLIEENCWIIKVSSAENIPVRPVIEEFVKEVEDWEEKQKEREVEEEKERLRRLMEKYPDIAKE